MVVIVNIAIMKFLPFMNMGVPRSAARVIRRGLMRNRAGKTLHGALHPCFYGGISLLDFGGDPAWPDVR